MPELYYTPPSDKIFNEVRDVAIKLWREIDTDWDRFGYATSKINRIKDIPNVKDNLMYIVAMLSANNIAKLLTRISPEAREELNKRCQYLKYFEGCRGC